MVILLHGAGRSIHAHIRPLGQIHLLILERVRQLVSQHRLLLLRLDPVQQIHRLRLVVVEAGDLLRQQRDEKRPQMKVPVQQPELLQHDLGPLHALRTLVLVELHLEVMSHLIARYQLALYAVRDREFCVVAHEAQNLVNGAE